MSNTLTDEFEASLSGVDVSVTRTTVDNFADVLPDVVLDPAVGVPLPFEDVSLDEAGVPVDPTPADLRAAATGVTASEVAVSTYGSVLLRCTSDGAEFLSLYPDRHVAVVRASDIEATLREGIDAVADRMRDEAGDFIVATGPSATADMGSVVQGVHGPRDVHVVLLEDR